MLSPFPYTTALLAGLCFVCFLVAHHAMTTVSENRDRYPDFILQTFLSE